MENDTDRAAIAESILDRMVVLMLSLANYPGQPTVTQWEQMQREARAIVAESKALRAKEKACTSSASST